jgi:bacteriocin-like protein
MNTSIKELKMNELEQVIGGGDWLIEPQGLPD